MRHHHTLTLVSHTHTLALTHTHTYQAKTTVVNTAEDGTDQSERRVTRAALRSQQLQQQSDG